MGKFNVFAQSRQKAAEAGYAVFNQGQHLCVDVDLEVDHEGTKGCTITVKTNGKLITFAFNPGIEGLSPACVDISHHTGKEKVDNKGELIPVQDMRAFTLGGCRLWTKPDDKEKVTVVLWDAKRLAYMAAVAEEFKYQPLTFNRI